MDIWHQCFGHIAVETIKNAVQKGLLDGLDMIGDHKMKGTCKDCIFGKMHNLPYNEEVIHETRVMEHIHVDLWGPSLVTSAGGSRYFMLLMDGALSFRTVEFLREKSAKNTLAILKAYITEGKRQTNQKLLRVRVD